MMRFFCLLCITFDIVLKYPEITEVQGGTYALMDVNYPYMPFDIAVAHLAPPAEENLFY